MHGRLDLGGRSVPLRIRRDRRARRLVLRIDQESDGVVVTVPDGLPDSAGLAFARRQAGWILTRLDALPERIGFVDGAEIPVLGVACRIHHQPDGRGGVWRNATDIHVTGPGEHLARRLTDWLKREARREIVARTAEKAARLGVDHGRVTLRDTRSRWGSCAANGNLSFCWRLILAPDFVLDYVVAHEVAHLAMRDHGPRFRAVVARLTEFGHEGPAWLRRHGHRLRRYG